MKAYLYIRIHIYSAIGILNDSVLIVKQVNRSVNQNIKNTWESKGIFVLLQKDHSIQPKPCQFFTSFAFLGETVSFCL